MRRAVLGLRSSIVSTTKRWDFPTPGPHVEQTFPSGWSLYKYCHPPLTPPLPRSRRSTHHPPSTLPTRTFTIMFVNKIALAVLFAASAYAQESSTSTSPPSSTSGVSTCILGCATSTPGCTL